MDSVYQKVWQDPYMRSYILKFIITPRCKNCICKLKSNETYFNLIYRHYIKLKYF